MLFGDNHLLSEALLSEGLRLSIYPDPGQRKLWAMDIPIVRIAPRRYYSMSRVDI